MSVLIFFIIGLVMFVENVNMNSINILTSYIQQDFGFNSEANVQLIQTVYNIAYTSLILFGGNLGDVYGNRWIWLIGMFLLFISTLICGLSINKEVFIISRIVQGIAYSLIHPTSNSMIHLKEVNNGNLNKYIGLYYVYGLFGSIFGLILSGVFVEYLKWKWLFYLQSIIILMLFFAGIYILPIKQPVINQHLTKNINVVENFILITLLSSFSYYFTASYNYGWGSNYALQILLVAYGSLLSFILFNLYNKKILINLSEVSLIPFDIFYKEMKYFIFMFIDGCSYNSFVFLSPLYFQNNFNLSFIFNVILNIIQLLITIIFVSFTTKLINDSNQYHIMNFSGFVFSFGLIILSLSSQSLISSIFCSLLICCGIGMNIGSTSTIINKIASSHSSGNSKIGVISSLSTLVFTSGMIIGLSITTSLCNSTINKNETNYSNGFLFNGLLFVIGSMITTYLTMKDIMNNKKKVIPYSISDKTIVKEQSKGVVNASDDNVIPY